MDDNERIELNRTDGGDHFLMVERFADRAAVQTYTLRSQYTEGCQDDDMERQGGDQSTEAITLRPGAGAFNWQHDLVLCSDSDWYRMVVLENETLTVRAEGPEGMSLSLHRLDQENNASDAVAQSQAAGQNEGRTIYELTYQGAEAFAFFGLQVQGAQGRNVYNLAITVGQ
jgi:hypothetical protein